MDPRSAEIASSVERDGYSVVPDVVSHDEVERLRLALDRAYAGPLILKRGDTVYGMRDLLRSVTEIRALAGSFAIRSLVEPVLGPAAFAVRGLLFDKTAEANWIVPWHRDLTIAVRERRNVPGFGPWNTKAGIQHVRPPVQVLERMLTLRVHLDEASENNGPLAVLPGSHRCAEGDVAPSDSELSSGVVARLCPVPCGGVLLMRPLILHASSSSREPARRRVVHLEFAADPLPGGLEWFEASA
jgi:ectoine hydroxylase-related dioxygenase (phytanoyl-CoA dioxygenase family)